MLHNIGMINTKKLCALRVARGFNQTQFAEHVGLSRSHYSHIERGERKPSYATLQAIARGLDTTVEELLSDGALISPAREIVIEHTDERSGTTTRYVMPMAPETYRLVAERLAGAPLRDEEALRELLSRWEKLDKGRKARILAILREE